MLTSQVILNYLLSNFWLQAQNGEVHKLLKPSQLDNNSLSLKTHDYNGVLFCFEEKSNKTVVALEEVVNSRVDTEKGQ